MILFFLAGLSLVFVGWKMTGEMKGLLIMLVGLFLLLSALMTYNSAYQDRKKP